MLRHDAMGASAGAGLWDDREGAVFDAEPAPASGLRTVREMAVTTSSARLGESGAEKAAEAPAPGSPEAAAAAASDGIGWFGVMVAFFSIFGLVAFSRRA